MEQSNIAEATDFLQGLQDSWVRDTLKKAGLTPVKDVVVALSFPTSGGEAVVPPLDKEGRPNANAGEARKRFQYIPAIASEDGRIDPAIKGDVTMSYLTKGAKVGANVPVVCITPARHNRWAGSVFGPGNDPVAETAARLTTLLHANIFAAIVNDPPDGIDLTKGGKVKVYNGHFERYAAKVGLMGKGWTVDPKAPTFAEIMDLARTAPAGASINLDVPEKADGPTTTSVTLRASDGTEFTISAKTKPGKKDGSRAAVELLRTLGPFTYVRDKADEDARASKASPVDGPELDVTE